MWKPIKGYENKYEVSDGGEVRNVKTGRVLSPTVMGIVMLTKDREQWEKDAAKARLEPKRKGRWWYPGRVVRKGSKSRHEGLSMAELVLTHFVGSKPRGMKAGFKDGMIDNMSVGNLEWVAHDGQYQPLSEEHKRLAEDRKQAQKDNERWGNIGG